MIEEVEDIVSINRWEYHIFDREFPKNSLNKKTFNDDVYGICFTPPDCETVTLTFLSNGRLCNPFYFLKCYKEDLQDKNFTAKMRKTLLFSSFTKTQYAGPSTHKKIITLFRYLNQNYFTRFKMYDESKYWETNDEKVMYENFNVYNSLVNSVASAFKNFPMKDDEPIVEYFKRAFRQQNFLTGKIKPDEIKEIKVVRR
ncbi:MAG: hypothetical protein A3H98_07280 [Bacteroidetes bacterium RIFCSPLOWO2_02_FULL_36_8]|nr:MAG: hypothetical protein A3H98_07280 [Bacteroidetes bacterium RIFCSPLOWO2_02_FULL_36_8]OFY69674.1 MAG: hypothetical protein A3G23_14185 [Bacteroidetes bacterium RIFCSPLOWO2_12_FULL_37_12]